MATAATSPIIAWETPESFVEGKVLVPEMSPDLIPQVLRPWATDIAERMCVPLSYVAAMMTVSLGFLLAGMLGVRPKARDIWLVVTNLYGMIVGPPGVLKSPVMEAVRSLITAIQNRLNNSTEGTDTKTKVKISKAIKAKEEKALLKALVATKDEAEREKYRQALYSLNEEAEDNPPKRLIVNDVTIPKLQEINRDNPRGVFWFRDELVALFAATQMSGHEPDLGYLLECANGLNPHTCDRIERGTIELPCARLSIFGSGTPEGLQHHLQASYAKTSSDGLAQRFQIVAYPDLVPWVDVDRAPDEEAAEVARNIFERLYGFQADDSIAVDKNHNIPFVHFDLVAQQIFDIFRNRLEIRVRQLGTEHPIMLAHLSKFRALMPKLALINYVVDCIASGKPITAIDERSASMAVKQCDFWELNARRTYENLSKVEFSSAYMLSRKILDGSLEDGFKLRDIQRPSWSGLTEHDTIEAALTLLVDMHWLNDSQIDPNSVGRGRKPGRCYFINPEIRARRVDRTVIKPPKKPKLVKPKNRTPPPDKADVKEKASYDETKK